MKGRMRGSLTVLLALLLVLAPAPLLAGGIDVPAAEDGLGKALKYAGCAGAIVFAVAVPASIFYAALMCASAFVDSN